MTTEFDYVTVANSAKIPLSIRTLKPYLSEGLPPWVALGHVIQALTYLARRISMDPAEIRVLEESLDVLYYSVKALRDETSDSRPAGTRSTDVA